MEIENDEKMLGIVSFKDKIRKLKKDESNKSSEITVETLDGSNKKFENINKKES